MITGKSDISTAIESQAGELDRLGVQSLRLFGSFASGQQTENSDVDILVEFAPGKKNYDAFVGTAWFLEALFQRRVELVTLESLSVSMQQKVLATSEYVFRRN